MLEAPAAQPATSELLLEGGPESNAGTPRNSLDGRPRAAAAICNRDDSSALQHWLSGEAAPAKPQRHASLTSRSSTGSISAPKRSASGSLVVSDAAAYLPRQVMERYTRCPLPPTEPLSEEGFAVIMVADIGGFTKLTAWLDATIADGQGAWKINYVVNQYFGAMCSVIAAHGGDVIKFAGDALVVAWSIHGEAETDPDAQAAAAARAGRCALQLAQLEHVRAAQDVELALHTSLACGHVAGMHVGGLNGKWEFFISGSFFQSLGPLVDATPLNHVVVSEPVWELLERAGAEGEPVACAVPAVRLVSMPSEDSEDPYAPMTAAGAASDSPGSSLERATPETATAAALPTVQRRASAASGTSGGSGPLSSPALLSRRSSFQLDKKRVDPILQCYLPEPVVEHLRARQQAWLAENRQISVVFVKLPTLHSSDFALAQALVLGIQGVLARHAGMLRQFLTDDKGTVAILVWGCPPMSHVDDPLRAARAAVELRESLERAVWDQAGAERAAQEPISAGVTTGWAYSGNIGSASRAEYTVMGDVAARLMGHCAKRGGGVACDRTTREFLFSEGSILDGLCASEERHVLVKGKPAPIGLTDLSPGVRTSAPADAAEAGPRPAGVAEMFVGRRAELRVLQDLATDFLAGTAPSALAIVEGRQGMGKTAFLESFEHTISSRIVTLLLHGQDAERIQPWHCFHTDWFQDLAETYLPTLPPEQRKRASLLRDVVPALRLEGEDEGDGTRIDEDELSTEAADGEPWEGAAPPVKLEGNASASPRVAAVMELALLVLQAAASADLLAIIADDGQFMDPLSWSLLMEIKRRIRPILVVIGYRPARQGNFHGRTTDLYAQPGALRLTLGPLDAADIQQLVRLKLGVSELSGSFARQVQAADGHPLFLRELLRLWRHNQVAGGSAMPDSEDEPSTSGRQGSTLPTLDETAEQGQMGLLSTSRLGHLMRARLDGLSMDARLAVKTAAVIGERFTMRLINRVCTELSKDQLECARLELLAEEIWGQRTHLLQRRDSGTKGDEPTLTFTHAVIHQVALDSIPSDQRAHLHACVLQALEADLQAISTMEAIGPASIITRSRSGSWVLNPASAGSRAKKMESSSLPLSTAARQADRLRDVDEALAAVALELEGDISLHSNPSIQYHASMGSDGNTSGHGLLPLSRNSSMGPGGSGPGHRGAPFRRHGRAAAWSGMRTSHGLTMPQRPTYALLGHHARMAGQHIRAAAYYLASAKHSSLDFCLRNGMMRDAVKYVEEGLLSLGSVGESGESGGPGSTADTAAQQQLVELESELKAVLTAMTAVQQSWDLVEAQMDAIGQDFFVRLFEIDETLLRFFGFKDDVDYRTSRGLRAHAAAVMRTVGKLVAGLSDLQSVMPMLIRLGRSHSANKIQPAYFDLMRDCLLASLAYHLGPIKWTPEVDAAWRAAFNVISASIVSHFTKPSAGAAVGSSSPVKPAGQAVGAPPSPQLPPVSKSSSQAPGWRGQSH